MLALANISKIFSQAQHPGALACKPVLRKISTTFQPGQLYAITGPSGAGKSTLLALLAGLDTPTSGEITWQNKPITSMTRAQVTGFLLHECALIFQYPYLIGELNVLENCMLKGLAAGMSLQECQTRAHELLTLLGIHDRAPDAPLTLSGGEQQRVAVARALFLRPQLVIADEPTAHLDEQNKKIIIDTLAQCAHTQGAVVIVSSHDEYVKTRADQVFALANGSLATEQKIPTRPELSQPFARPYPSTTLGTSGCEACLELGSVGEGQSGKFDGVQPHLPSQCPQGTEGDSGNLMVKPDITSHTGEIT